MVTNETLVKFVLILLLVVIVGLVIFAVLANRKVNALEERIGDVLLQRNDEIRKSLDALSDRRRDSVIVLNRNITATEERRRHEEVIVLDTGSIDSLIQLYWRHRPNLGP